LWVELIPVHLDRDLPPAGVPEIGYHTPFTPTDALLILLGAEMWLCEPYGTWAIDKREENRFQAGRAIGASCGTIQAAMYRIRRDLLDSFLKEPACPTGGPLP
jgi:hypothetical protein